MYNGGYSILDLHGCMLMNDGSGSINLKDIHDQIIDEYETKTFYVTNFGYEGGSVSEKAFPVLITGVNVNGNVTLNFFYSISTNSVGIERLTILPTGIVQHLQKSINYD